MPRKYVRSIGKKPYATYTEAQLRKALLAVRQGTTLRYASEKYGVPRSTLCRHINNKNTGKYGRPPVFRETDENTLAECISLAGDWGFPFTKYDMRCIVKAHLDRKGVTESRFKNNLPGPDWTESFLKRNKDKLTERLCQNIKRARAAVNEEIINEYFDRLEESLKGVEPAAMINYDETNLTDDPKRQRVIVRRKSRHPEKILDNSKSSTSVMFSVTGTGHILPVYINYKAEHLYDTWTTGGPPGAIYNRSKSGWFTMEQFEDWFKTVALPYFRKLDKNNPKVLIGDNLSSHISEWVIEKCKEHNIRFILLPTNSTGLCQPLDVAFFKPLKTKWSKVLSEWKLKNRGVIPKDTFPRLLKKCLEELKDKSADNVVAGFKGSGLIPLNRTEVLKRLPQTKLTNCDEPEKWVDSFKDFLQKIRTKETQPMRQVKKKRHNIKPGVSITNVEAEKENKEPKIQGKKKKRSKAKSESDTDTDATLSLRDSDCDINFRELDDDESAFFDPDISILEGIFSKPLRPASNLDESIPIKYKQNILSPIMPNQSNVAENEPPDTLTMAEQKLNVYEEKMFPPKKDHQSPHKTDLSSTKTDYKKGEFVIVKFIYNSGKKKAVEKRFVGQVLDAVEESHVFVKFMRKSSKVENTFIFPQVDDEQLVAPENVILKIHPLNISRGRHLFPKFIKEYCCS